MPESQPHINQLSVVVSVHSKLNGEGLTTRDLAAATDIPAAMLHRLFAGFECPKEAYLALCKWLEKDPSDFFERQDE
ncbi:hypothetical protein GCM10007874_31620 [Labrys miyagiensis]|uniref:HTH cro/C1-type domain-containing protein n=1 Tax=Labrys miyagiensis TaxID=346912 RepID=A0ABQ6CJS8_9HYPH|nr:helix-turn-helix domain-containing protein [Labrys miyagiensis]GLS20145.1 hypothetical protein GCM10007874_31620 [Labrys miyagiensis]